MNSRQKQNQAERLADTMLALASKPVSNQRTASTQTAPLVKLPPVFTTADKERYGDGKRNLVAMIKVIAEYESGMPNGERPTLSDLPARYNHYEGLPLLEPRDMRRVHNWLQQVSFAMRAAMLDQEESEPTPGMEHLSASERATRRLYGDRTLRRAFVTLAPDSRYEYKPLRDAPISVIQRWMDQELSQKRAWARGHNVAYGAKPTTAEWDAYGIHQQTRTLTAQIASELKDMVREASQADMEGRHLDAEAIDQRMLEMRRSLDYFDVWESAPAR